MSDLSAIIDEIKATGTNISVLEIIEFVASHLNEFESLKNNVQTLVQDINTIKAQIK